MTWYPPGRARSRRASSAPASREVLRLAVAVRAEQLEVLEPVVVAVPVDVVERHAQRRAAPLLEAAALAPVLLEPQAEEPPLHVPPAAPASEQLLDRHGAR